MKTTLIDLAQTLRNGTPVAYTALVETKGSTPQKPGATMLVFPDGSQSGTLGGGCVEAEVKRNALRLLDAGDAGILTFQLDSDMGWDDGLICGGRMKMLVDPIRPGQDGSYYRTLSDLTAAGKGATEAIIVDADRAGGGRDADQFLLDANSDVVATRGSGNVPSSLLSNLKSLADRPSPYVVEGIAYLTHLPRCRLLIVGGGHVGQKVAELAGDADFDVWVVDDREQYCNIDRFPRAQRLLVGDIGSTLGGLEIDGDTFCIIVTRGHNHDEEALYHLAETPARFVGLIGSKRKIKIIFEDLLGEGISRDALARVHAPLGLDIGSQTVPEIAVSIVAELIAVRNLGEVPAPARRPSLLPPAAALTPSPLAERAGVGGPRPHAHTRNARFDRTMLNRREFTAVAAGVASRFVLPGLYAADPPPKRASKYIDVHTHVGTYVDGNKELTVKGLLDWMDEHDVERSVVLPLVSPESTTYLQLPDVALQAAKDHPDRLTAFCSIDPRAIISGGVKGLTTIIKKYVDRGAKGFGEHKVGLDFDDPLMMHVYEACQNLGIPLLFHIDGVRGKDQPGLPRLEHAIAMFPGCTFIGHGPGWWTSISGKVKETDGYPEGAVEPGGAIDRLMEKYPNIFGDLSAGSGANAISRDKKFGREFMIRRQDRLMFGTDYLQPGQDVPQFELFDSLELPPDVQAKIFKNNAQRVIKIT